MQHQNFLAVILQEKEKVYAKQSGVDFMPNKCFQLFTMYILITFCVAEFRVILIFTTSVWYFCRVLVRRSSTEPCINWWRHSREAEGRFTNFTCPTATRMDFITANRYVPFSPSLLTAVLWPARYSQPFHSPLLPNSHICSSLCKQGYLVVRAEGLSFSSRWAACWWLSAIEAGVFSLHRTCTLKDFSKIF